MPWSHLLCHCGDIGVGVQDDPGDVAPSIPDIVLMSPRSKGPVLQRYARGHGIVLPAQPLAEHMQNAVRRGGATGECGETL